MRGTLAAEKAGISMGHTIKLAAVGAVAFMVLDGVWLGLLMKNFYREQLAPIVRLADGGIAPNWPAAFVVYVLLGTGIALFVIPRASTRLVRGRASGLCSGWSCTASTISPTTRRCASGRSSLTLADMAWGALAIGRRGGGRADRGAMSKDHARARRAIRSGRSPS